MMGRPRSDDVHDAEAVTGFWRDQDGAIQKKTELGQVLERELELVLERELGQVLERVCVCVCERECVCVHVHVHVGKR